MSFFERKLPVSKITTPISPRNKLNHSNLTIKNSNINSLISSRIGFKNITQIQPNFVPYSKIRLEIENPTNINAVSPEKIPTVNSPSTPHKNYFSPNHSL